MRSFRFVLLLVLIAFAKAATAQQATPSAPQATALLQQALATLSGGHPLTDVTLSGAAQRIAGSDDESGTVVLKALATGESRVDLTFPSGPGTEIRANSATGPVGSWSGPDGTSHPISQHNLWTDSSWFFQAFTFARLLNDPSYTISYVGQETRNGQAVQHLNIIRTFQATGAPTGWSPASLQNLSGMDIYLDSTTYLPAALLFNAHPDLNQTINIPIEIRFSNYQQTNGAPVPLRIQKFLNNALALDLQITAVSPNTGIPVSTFNVQ
jgi:hypothetical protein